MSLTYGALQASLEPYIVEHERTTGHHLASLVFGGGVKVRATCEDCEWWCQFEQGFSR